MSGCSATQFGGVPYVGALFDSSNGQRTTHFATAFVVAGKYGNMLMSAAHILNGRSASSIIFAPGYADGQAATALNFPVLYALMSGSWACVACWSRCGRSGV